MPRKINPKSLDNLNWKHGLKSPGRRNTYDEAKGRHGVTLTETGWAGVQATAQKFNLSVSELFERVGRGQLKVVDLEELEDQLDLQDALEAEAHPDNQEPIAWEQVKQELGL